MSLASTNDVMRRALLRVDDDYVLSALDQINFKTATKVSAVVGMPLRSLAQKRDVPAFATGAPIAAVRAMLELLALAPLEKLVEMLGEHAESPSFEQLSEAIDRAQANGMSDDDVVAVLAFAVGEQFPAAAQCRRLLEERASWTLPDLPASTNPGVLVPKRVDEEVREQRRRRREEEKRKKVPTTSRPARPAKARRAEKSTPALLASPVETPPLAEIVRRRLIFTPSELETFAPEHALVGAVVLVDVPFDAVDPMIPEQRSKIRPALVVAAAHETLLVRGIYSNPSPSRVLFQPWRRLGLAHVSFVAIERVSVPANLDTIEKVGRLSDEEWNSLF
ncbi:MAG: hypothetical protein WAN30_08040 [Acidimicrobiales bacterium]